MPSVPCRQLCSRLPSRPVAKTTFAPHSPRSPARLLLAAARHAAALCSPRIRRSLPELPPLTLFATHHRTSYPFDPPRWSRVRGQLRRRVFPALAMSLTSLHPGVLPLLSHSPHLLCSSLAPPSHAPRRSSTHRRRFHGHAHRHAVVCATPLLRTFCYAADRFLFKRHDADATLSALLLT